MKLLHAFFFLLFSAIQQTKAAQHSKNIVDDPQRSLTIEAPVIVGPSTIECGSSASYTVHIQGTGNLFGDFDIDYEVKDSDLIWNDPLANGTVSDPSTNPIRVVIFNFSISCSEECEVVGPDGPSGESTAEVFVNAYQQGTLDPFGTNSDNKSVTCVTPAPSGSPTAAPTDSETGGSGGGEPHFVTWDRTHYSFHGQCDLVMTSSQEFGNGKGLNLHIRTTIQDNFSYISGTALQIKDAILEVDSDGNHYINGEKEVELPSTIAGYTVSKVNNTNEANKKFHVELDDGNLISIRAFKGFMYVTLSATIPGGSGLLGTYGKPGMVSREGTLLEAANDMGASWQVNGSDVSLFRSSRDPQWPKSCMMPEPATAPRRRLGEKAALERDALEACAHVEGELHSFCMFDVIQTGDVDLATQYGEAGF